MSDREKMPTEAFHKFKNDLVRALVGTAIRHRVSPAAGLMAALDAIKQELGALDRAAARQMLLELAKSPVNQGRLQILQARIYDAELAQQQLALTRPEGRA